MAKGKAIEKNSGLAWAAAITITLACTASAIVSNKFSPALTTLMDTFNITLTESSLLSSVVSIGGIVMALLSGAVATKIGNKKMCLIGILCLIVGSIIGLLTPNYIVLLLSRVIEGFGNAFMMVLGPSVIAKMFTKDKVGLPMGIQGVWNPLGGFLVLTLGAPIMAAASWQGLWWFGLILSIIVFVLVWFFVPEDSDIDEGDKRDGAASKGVNLVEVLKNPAVWLLALVMAGYTVTSVGVQGFAPVYLQQAAGYTQQDASLVSSILPFGKMVGSILAGALMIKFRKKQNILVIILVIVAILSFFLFRFTADTSVFFIMGFFLITGTIMLFTPPTAQSLNPELLTDPRAVAMSMGVIVFLQNIASFFAPTLITGSVEASGGDWSSAGVVVTICVVIAIAGAVGICVLLKRKGEDKATTEISES